MTAQFTFHDGIAGGEYFVEVSSSVLLLVLSETVGQSYESLANGLENEVVAKVDVFVSSVNRTVIRRFDGALVISPDLNWNWWW